MRRSINLDCLAVVMLSVLISSPVITIPGFAGGGDCTFDDESTICATGGPPGSNCVQVRSTCTSGTTWISCEENEGNWSETCENDSACSSGKNARRMGTCDSES